jgi:hypothetical protein
MSAPEGIEPIVRGLQAEFARAAPLLILSPTPRCGSTLLQRAINQAEGAIVYGENTILVEHLPQIVFGNLRNFGPKTQVVDATLKAFLAGNKGMDASALFPDYAEYRRLLIGFFFRLTEFYRAQAEASGYARWGLKHQMLDAAKVKHFLALLPEWRGVALYRDVVAVARSARARWPENFRTPAQCKAFGTRWRMNLRYLRTLDAARSLLVRYEDLIGPEQESWIARIEAHLGLKLSRQAFEKKVNAHVFDLKAGKPGETYRPPVDLPGPMATALLQGAEPLYSRIGYRREASV